MRAIPPSSAWAESFSVRNKLEKRDFPYRATLFLRSVVCTARLLIFGKQCNGTADQGADHPSRLPTLGAGWQARGQGRRVLSSG